MSKRLAIVILNWNGAGMMRRFLPSVLAHSGEAQVVVADNASSDDSLAMLKAEFPEVHTIVLDRNYGFAEGYNRALRQVEAEYYLLLNRDVEVPQGWTVPLLDYMDAHPQTAACQPKIRCQWSPESFEYAGACGGYIDWLGYPYCRGRIFNKVEKDHGQYDEVRSAVWATGAALMIRSNAYWQAGGLDGRFFAHQEEIDLCWRVRSRGLDIVCIPQSVVYHVGGGTLPKGNPRKTYLNFRNNLLLLYKNLPDDALAKVMHWRLLLDALASVQFLLKGSLGDFLAVWRARRDFRQMKSDFLQSRQENMAAMVTLPETFLTPKCLLWQFYVRGCKTFSQLHEDCLNN